MTIKEFELKLKELSENFIIKDLTEYNILDICSIRYLENGKELDVCVCPSREIFEEPISGYTDDGGVRHRTVSETIEICNGFKNKLENDKDFYAYTVFTDSELDVYEAGKV
jgi:hypothetical protein